MTYEELRAEAKKMGYRLSKEPEYDCVCYEQYPNEKRKRKNGRWLCVERFEPIEVVDGNAISGHKGGPTHKFTTYCRRRAKENGK